MKIKLDFFDVVRCDKTENESPFKEGDILGVKVKDEMKEEFNKFLEEYQENQKAFHFLNCINDPMILPKFKQTSWDELEKMFNEGDKFVEVGLNNSCC